MEPGQPIISMHFVMDWFHTLGKCAAIIIEPVRPKISMHRHLDSIPLSLPASLPPPLSPVLLTSIYLLLPPSLSASLLLQLSIHPSRQTDGQTDISTDWKHNINKCLYEAGRDTVRGEVCTRRFVPWTWAAWQCWRLWVLRQTWTPPLSSSPWGEWLSRSGGGVVVLLLVRSLYRESRFL